MHWLVLGGGLRFEDSVRVSGVGLGTGVFVVSDRRPHWHLPIGPRS